MSDPASEAPLRLREQHHAITRQAILRAARQLFADRGYSGVSIKLIAERAGVAIQTIYAAFGSKAGVVMALADLLDDEAGVIEAAQELARLDDPHEMVRLLARIQRQIRDRCGDLVRTLRSGASAEPDVAAAWTEGLRRRHEGISRLTTRLDARRALKEGLTSARAADIATALVADDVCEFLVERRGWSFDEYEAWLADTLVALLLK